MSRTDAHAPWWVARLREAEIDHYHTDDRPCSVEPVTPHERSRRYWHDKCAKRREVDIVCDHSVMKKETFVTAFSKTKVSCWVDEQDGRKCYRILPEGQTTHTFMRRFFDDDAPCVCDHWSEHTCSYSYIVPERYYEWSNDGDYGSRYDYRHYESRAERRHMRQEMDRMVWDYNSGAEIDDDNADVVLSPRRLGGHMW